MADKITCNVQKISDSVAKLEGYYNSMLSYQESLNFANFCDSRGSTVDELNAILEKLRVNIEYRLQIMEKVITVIKSFESNMQEADKFSS